ncbi:alpha-ketoglutarate-dependent dioxygenase AlkB [Aquiflexum sp. TKW24L]|uniref:alpha-ketoglutarate-dependent dioxygenase AlkB family protein n=1 Tax=Aquiflexum sp. TKW24L TaxID=2942212 RepID=UPI0020BE8F47|nr:alpha-ketoglutarate-dependent dioxygenase AlkB [Aquiflexum sp. TKW24L]MCL6259069.1 alpha-ketoglutarate-dependent dioxygenase AlkB [Aquiflexum sp. TKW24L]
MLLFENSFEENLLPFKGEVHYYPSFFDKSKSDKFLNQLKEEVLWRHEPIWMFGKKVMQPRLTALYGNPQIAYGYSGIEMKPLDWSPFLSEIKNRIEDVADTEFTHVLLNYYRDGQDSMGWHRDNEKVLGNNPVIGSVSFGISRDFQLRLYADKSNKRTILLEHGSLLLMKGETQHHWEHQIPKSKTVRGPRVNLTFRKIF